MKLSSISPILGYVLWRTYNTIYIFLPVLLQEFVIDFVTQPDLGPLAKHSQTSLLTPGRDEGNCGVSCKVPSVGPGKENRGFLLKRPKVSDGFLGRVFFFLIS